MLSEHSDQPHCSSHIETWEQQQNCSSILRLVSLYVGSKNRKNRSTLIAFSNEIDVVF